MSNVRVLATPRPNARLCENDRHTVPVEAVAVIRLVELPESDGYHVCPECLGRYVVEIYLNKTFDLRLAFVVEPC